MKHPSSQLVYVIVLNWNGWKDTIECLSSLRHSDYPNYEIVVVDNNSEDDSVVRIREAHPQVPIIQAEDNLGFAGGNNLGIRYALSKGAEFVWLLNNDTKVMKNTLSSMVELAMRNPDVGVVGS
ncbi:MAG: glycosyltransferase family 2 protein, partial [Meiothermus sp.]|uniref:glycosyltransferase family 2 protein n=1 Tax=Meiothermus sp. TaxID=1955249 RepID=UPI00298F0A09